MRISIGGHEFEIALVGKTDVDLLNLPLKELLLATSGSAKLGTVMNVPELLASASRTQAGGAVATPQKLFTLEVLKYADFSPRTIVMLARKLLKINSRSTELELTFPQMNEGVKKWASASLPKDLWAVYIAEIDVPKLGRVTAAVAITRQNQFYALGVGKDTPALLKSLSDRHMQFKQVSLVITTSTTKQTEIKKAFPKAQVALDWEEVAQRAKPKDQAEIMRAMTSAEPKEVKRLIKAKGLPQELMTYYAFPNELWRVLRTIGPLRKIEAELRSITRIKLIQGDEQMSEIINWTLLRLQYHWLKIPVDSSVLSNLKYIKLQAIG